MKYKGILLFPHEWIISALQQLKDLQKLARKSRKSKQMPEEKA